MLFVVMMMDINTEVLRKGFWRHFPVTALLGAVVSAQLIVVLWFIYGYSLAFTEGNARSEEHTSELQSP